MANFSVLISSAEPAEVVLVPAAADAEPIRMGAGEDLLFPLLSEYVGQLVLVTSYERFPDSLVCGSGLDRPMVCHIMPPRQPSPHLLSAWLGRLAGVWPREPILDKMKPLVSEEATARWDQSLFEALCGLYRNEFDQRITLFVGTVDVLTELRRLLAEHSSFLGHERSVVEAVLSLKVSQADLGVHVPYLLTLISQVQEQSQSALEDRMTDLRIAGAALEAAQVAFGVAKRQCDAAAEKARQLAVLHRGWLAVPHPGTATSPHEAPYRDFLTE